MSLRWHSPGCLGMSPWQWTYGTACMPFRQGRADNGPQGLLSAGLTSTDLLDLGDVTDVADHLGQVLAAVDLNGHVQ